MRWWGTFPAFHAHQTAGLQNGETDRKSFFRVSGVVSRARKLSSRLHFVDVSPSGALEPTGDEEESVTHSAASSEATQTTVRAGTTADFSGGGSHACSGPPLNKLVEEWPPKQMTPPPHTADHEEQRASTRSCLPFPEERKSGIHVNHHSRNGEFVESGSGSTTDPSVIGGRRTQLLFDFAEFVGICRSCCVHTGGPEKAVEQTCYSEICTSTQQKEDPRVLCPTDPFEHFQTIQNAVEGGTPQPRETAFASLCSLLHHAGCELRVLGYPTKTRSGQVSLVVTFVTYLKAPPAYEALNRLCKCVETGGLPLEILIASTRAQSQSGDWLGSMAEKTGAQQLLQFAAPERKRVLKQLCRCLTGRPVERMRPPSFSMKDFAILDLTTTLRTTWPVTEFGRFSGVPDMATTTLFPPSENPQVPSSADKDANYRKYMVQKKCPQVRWMIQRVRDVYHALLSKQIHESDSLPPAPKNNKPSFRCLDVGGGKGDLGIALATAFPEFRVTVLDINATSLEAARQRARDSGILNIDFVCDDFSHYEISSDTRLIVGLHSCGGLADCILARAVALGASFLVCTCCFCKHPHLRTEFLVKRLRELHGSSLPLEQEADAEFEPGTETYSSLGRLTTVKDSGVSLTDPWPSPGGTDPKTAIGSQLERLLMTERLLPLLCRLAESSERAMSLQAMHAVNAWRMACVLEISRQPDMPPLSGSNVLAEQVLYRELCIKAFSEDYSPKNLVLTGVAR
ncbi:methyltransferase domain-containing protein [Besnoitia besnoiti]|uniref:Methyltransferase domain-containing protein n=1 Tax=Besnoitia besnoiti TaxID=94643 RepID=A0A2A9M347_BESBE|nr:methyltransferase domain-containing protein [Besnoitia besnoiti]PFH31644.1 methyltransferase domain-containing protein [Besnoitia besnoiti]